MPDYLISQYNEKVTSATVLKEDRIAKATQLWNDAISESISQWQSETTAALIEMETALEHRNRIYIEGPPVVKKTNDGVGTASEPTDSVQNGEPAAALDNGDTDRVDNEIDEN